MNAMTGRTIGNYRVIERLGEGGMGKVYRAVDVMMEREVAVKALKPEIASQPSVLDRFRSEAVMLGRLNHPSIAQIYSFFKEGDEYYMVMEYVAGKTLHALIREQGMISWERAVNYMVKILDGISHAHSVGVLHRDLKPANVMVTPADQIKIMDFGIAQALRGARLTREGLIVGTFEYLAPERIEGKAPDVRSDVYSAGIMLYEMLTGRVPFEADSEVEILMSQLHHVPEPPSKLGVYVPPGVEAVLFKAIEKRVEDRFPDAASFAVALSELVSRTTGSGQAAAPASAQLPRQTPAVPVIPEPVATPVQAAQPLTGPTPRISITPKQMAAGIGAAVILAGLVFGIGKLRPSQPEEKPQEVASAQPEPTREVPVQQAPSMVPPVNLNELKPVDVGSVPGTTPAQPEPGAPAPRETPPAPARKPAPLTPAARRAALAALEVTDGPAGGAPGVHPIHLRGIMEALRAAGPAINEDLRSAVVRRGVNFTLTPATVNALTSAGASPDLITAIGAGFRRVEPEPAPVTPPPPTRIVETPPTAPPPAAEPILPAKQIRVLADVHELYIESIDGELDSYLRDEIQKQLGARMRVTRSLGSADAIMRISVEESKGGTVSRAGRVLGLKDKSRVLVKIYARASNRLLWEQGAGDSKPIVGVFHGDATKRMANRIVKELREDLER